MTSNVGAKLITDKKTLGFSEKQDDSHNAENAKIKKDIMAELKNSFKPEFLNRIDDIIVFGKLSKEDVKQIIELMLKEVKNRLKDKEIDLEVDESVKELISQKGVDSGYGARPLRRAIQNLLEDAIAESFLDGRIKQGSNAVAKVEDGKVLVDIDKSN